MNIETIGAVIFVAILVAALGYFFRGSKSSKTEQELALSQQQVRALENQFNELKIAVSSAEEKREHLQKNLSEKEQIVSSTQASLEAVQRNLAERNEELRLARNELKEAQKTLAAMQTENAELRTSQQEKEVHHKQQLAQFAEQKAALKTEFQNLATLIFEEQRKVFTDKNKASLDEVLNPFKTQMKDFKDKVEDIHHKDIKQQAELKTEIKHLQVLNQQITEEAHNLSTALKGQKKMQGNWGEMILDNVLDRSGLVKGKDYKREVSITTEDGRRRPDVIVFLPDNKHLIIDAKVSLNAYTRFVNSEDEIEREQAQREHVRAVGSHIKELADRKYFDLPGLNSPDMVFMFIPIESAFVEAMKADESVFQKALELNVLVATPTTLLTSLNIVRQLWRFEDQNKHTAELAEKAAKVYDKLNSFLGSMENVGKSLERAKDSYDKAYSQLYDGRGNLIKQANEFKQLGVSVKAELPERLLEKAELELSHQLEYNAEQDEHQIETINIDASDVATIESHVDGETETNLPK